MREQGTLLDCPYCTLLHPEIKSSGNCPKCKGQGPRFTPARMMDKETSERELWFEIMNLAELWHSYREGTQSPEQMFSALLSMLSNLNLYNFQINDALITVLKDLEQEIETKKSN